MKKLIITTIGMCILLTAGLLTTIVIGNNRNTSRLIAENVAALSLVEGIFPIEGVGQGKVEKILFSTDFQTIAIDNKLYDCIVYQQVCVGQGKQFCTYRISYDCELSHFQ